MSTAPLISVIIPVYNTAPYLYESIGSIMNQTLYDIEIIVINDCSTDESDAIICSMMANDKRIIYKKFEINRGLSIARNEALKLAKGKYVYFMDSDDVILHDALEKCYSLCEKNNLDFVFFDGDVFCDKGIPSLSWNYQRTEQYDENTIYEGEELFKDMLNTYAHRSVVWLMLISRTHLERLSLSFYPGIIHEDELFTALLYLQTSRIGCLKQSLIKHRVRNNSIMTKRYSIRNVSCYITILDELFAFAHTYGHVGIVRKYARYTLNPVFETAKVLPYKDKVKVLYQCLRRGYLRYLSVKTLLKFLFK